MSHQEGLGGQNGVEVRAQALFLGLAGLEDVFDLLGMPPDEQVGTEGQVQQLGTDGVQVCQQARRSHHEGQGRHLQEALLLKTAEFLGHTDYLDLFGLFERQVGGEKVDQLRMGGTAVDEDFHAISIYNRYKWINQAVV